MKRVIRYAMVLAVVLMVVGTPSSTAVGRQAPEKQARKILDVTGVKGGLVVHLGCSDGKLTAALVLLLMVTMLLDRFYPLLGYLTACVGVVYHLEAIAIYVRMKDQTDENVTSLWQVVRMS